MARVSRGTSTGFGRFEASEPVDRPVRRFSASYLAHTREGMWSDGREALADCSLRDRDRALDVGCGTGAFTRVLAEETPQDATVIGVDADHARVPRCLLGEHLGERARPTADVEDAVSIPE